MLKLFKYSVVLLAMLPLSAALAANGGKEDCSVYPPGKARKDCKTRNDRWGMDKCVKLRQELEEWCHIETKYMNIRTECNTMDNDKNLFPIYDSAMRLIYKDKKEICVKYCIDAKNNKCVDK